MTESVIDPKEFARLEKIIKAQDEWIKGQQSLLACYRTGNQRRASAAIDKIDAAKAKLQKLGHLAEQGNQE